MRYLILLFICPALWAQKSTAWEKWRGEDVTWIRVGLKKPEKVISLASAGSILVLDGEKVIQTIKPGGQFRLIAGKGSASTRFWVQIKAAYNEKSLEKSRARVEGLYPNFTFDITNTASRMKALRVGPVSSQKEAEQLRIQMVKEGFKDAFPVKIGSSKFYWVDDNFDKHPLQAGDLAMVRTNPNDPIRYSNTPYRGILRFKLTSGKIRVINELPLETYLLGVVPSELGPRVYPELEALKAQAVAARTYVLKNMRRFSRKGYDICDGPACQAYEGMKNEMALSDEAVRDTEGLVLYYDDKLIDALYTSTSGGHTEDVENVFNGRAEPYLRGKTEYLAKFKSWTLPDRGVKVKYFDKRHEHLTSLALIYGYDSVPNLSGDLDGQTLEKALDAFSWILGKPPTIPPGDMSYRVFWQTVSGLSFFQDAIQYQLNQADVDRLLQAYTVPASLRNFVGLLFRYDLLSGEHLSSLSSEEPVSKVQAFGHLLQLCQALGPEPEWRRYLLEGVSNNKLQVRSGLTPHEIDLAGVQYYFAEKGGDYIFLDEPVLEERDRVYTLKKPFPNKFLKLRQNGRVASVDRFSVFDYWMEKKDLATLEARAKRYITGIKGIRDVKIVKRTKTGRVEEIQFITDAGNFKARGLNIRWSLGIKDNMFNMLPSYQNGKLVHVTFVGRGWGHGVGMSQVGAYGLARMGWTFDDILTYYYTDVELRPYQKP